MLNNITLVGKVVVAPNEKGQMKLAIQRTQKNKEGVYETDFVPVFLYGDLYQKTKPYVAVGDTVGIKGRVECAQLKRGKVQIIAEKATFLSS